MSEIVNVEYAQASEQEVPEGLAWVTSRRESSTHYTTEYAGSASGDEGSPWKRVTSHVTRRVEYYRLQP